MSQWKEPPPVVIISGNEDFLRQREVQEAISVANTVGRSVEVVQGTDADGISQIVSSSGVLFQEDVLVVVEEPDDISMEMVLEHHESGNSSICLLLHYVGLIKAKSNLGKIAAELPKRLVARFEKPKPWQETEYALDFLNKETKRLGISLPSPLATFLLQHVGVDLGMLSFELQKLAWLLAGEGKTEVKVEHLRGTIAAFTELGPKPVVDALEVRDLARTASALTNMRRTHSGQLSNATMRACAFIGRSATSWLHAACLLKKGRSTDEIAAALGQPPFVASRSTVPAARRWGEDKLLTLIRDVACAERAVKSGHVSAWVELESALLRALG